jgi:hypothetical protein
MKYADEIGSGAMLHIQSFIKFGSDVQKVMEDTQTHTHTHTQQGNSQACFFF